jgi:hypothetical protein
MPLGSIKPGVKLNWYGIFSWRKDKSRGRQPLKRIVRVFPINLSNM